MQAKIQSTAYALLKRYVDFCFTRFYRLSVEEIPQELSADTRIILAPNHQNALMDALAIHAAFPWKPYFLARSDIFRNPTVARILTFLNILPIYRIRDGYGQLSHNEKVFRKTFEVLHNHHPVTLLPEGNHQGLKKLRTLKKGVARIAFNYRHQQPEELKEVAIIPVGLNYFDYHEPGSPLVVTPGHPIYISRYDTLYHENPARATNAFMQDLRTAMKKSILHISEEKAYPGIDTLISLYAHKALHEGQSPARIVHVQKKMIEELEFLSKESPQEWEDKAKRADQIVSLLESRQLNIHDVQLVFTKNPLIRILGGSFLLLVTFPLYLFSWVQNILPRALLKTILGKFKDPHFKSSVLLVGTLLFFPVIHFLQWLVFAIVAGSLSLAGWYALSLPLSYLFFQYYGRLFQQTRKRIRIQKLSKTLQGLLKEIW